VGASIGIAKYPEHGTSLDMLLRAADIAMYEAKKYKNSVRLFAPSMQC
jgi:GGDEF domain-containing protein